MYMYLTLLVLFVHGIDGQVPFLGSCPDVKDVQQNFDVNRYLGTWIAVEKYFSIFEAGRKCVEAVYSLNENGTILLHNQMTGIITKKPYYMEGYATPAGDSGEGKLLIHLTSPIPFQGPYWILETDYDSYAVVWSCTQLIGINTQLAWILTRERNYTSETIEKAHAVFDKSNLTRKILYKYDQSDCPSYN